MLSFRGVFDQIYLINLPERTDRRRRVARELLSVGISLDRDVEIIPGSSVSDKGKFPNFNTFGCFRSHLHILEDAKKRGLKRILIIEDDLIISDRFKKVEPEVTKFLLEREWHIVLLGFFPFKNGGLSSYYKDIEKRSDFYDSIIFSTPNNMPAGLHFYAVSRDILDDLICYLRGVLKKRHEGKTISGKEIDEDMDPAYIDTALYQFYHDNERVRCFVACPSLGWQRDDRWHIVPRGNERLQKLDIIYDGKALLQRYIDRKFPRIFARAPNLGIRGCLAQMLRIQ